MKNRVPAAPQPSFGNATALSSTSLKTRPAELFPTASHTRAASPSPCLAPLGGAFIDKSANATILLSLLITYCLACVTTVPALALSFAGGTALAIGLLKSQRWFVQRLTSPGMNGQSQYRGRDAGIPLWLLVALKYLAVTLILAAALRQGLLVPGAFVAGFSLLQLVLFARVAGRLLSANLRPQDQVTFHDAKNA